MKFDILQHNAVPKHEILSEAEIKKIFSKLDYEVSQLPKIRLEDPVSKAIGAKDGDVLKITRESETAGTFITYRLVDASVNIK